ncbi:PP2C family protein-serine/threonine phosphatase [Leptolyngbya sp. 7M]|uniref:PP2C family protein-serine/threonine phosphatase n=1 Tax=Leptolyngbya sp. 7M TaxID=2812896 RepID=UPI001B8B1A60|nr:protein phosphatase 2C domain-containing protein [Leptolyngbya sp. 7M]QYO65238.1 protein phosphatase 2C domain-containing protein [Leptolyngbya sp. 7M]
MVSVEIHATSHVGRVRKGNEDNYLVLNISGSRAWTSNQDAGEFVIESQTFEIDDNGVVVAVSDGMGGALAGEVASKMAVESVCEKLLSDDIEETLTPEAYDYHLIAKLYNATLYANYLVHNQGRSDAQFQGMGATFTGIGITPRGVDVIQVGDSRAYLIRHDKIYQLTKDQSLVQQLIDAQQISPEEAETHTLKNVILQALGAQNEIYPVAARLAPCRDDVLLICSDGLSNKVSAAAMQQTVLENRDSLQQACAELVKQANENGGEDNITVVLTKLSGETLPEPNGEDVQLEMIDMGNIHDTADQDTAEIV